MSEKVCVFDIDGVLNYYPKTWVDFVNEETGSNFESLNIMKDNLSYRQYKALKEKYRISGVKENLDIRFRAKEAIDGLRELGYKIIIISARPVTKYSTLYKQTVNWLTKNGIEFDNLIFSERKQFEVIKYYPEMSFMVEDNRMLANIIASLGFKVFLMDNKYNQGEVNKNVCRVKNLMEVLENASK